jgi:hypothetical protein
LFTFKRIDLLEKSFPKLFSTVLWLTPNAFAKSAPSQARRVIAMRNAATPGSLVLFRVRVRIYCP